MHFVLVWGKASLLYENVCQHELVLGAPQKVCVSFLQWQVSRGTFGTIDQEQAVMSL